MLTTKANESTDGENDLLPASIRSSPSFNVYPQYYRIEDRVALLND